MNPALMLLWAKSDPFHPLLCHLTDVGNVAMALLATVPFRTTATRFAATTGCPEPQAAAWLAYLTSLHDLGKCHCRFQSKGPDSLIAPLIAQALVTGHLDSAFRHEVVSARWVFNHLMDDQGWTRQSAVTVAGALKAHHGNFKAEELDAEDSDAAAARWDPLRRELADQLWQTFQPGPWAAAFGDHTVAGVLLCGLLVLSDWIASNTELFSVRYRPGETMAEYAGRSSAMARNAIRRLGFAGESPWASGQSFRHIWPKIEKPNGLQVRIQKLVQAGVAPGLAIIEAPMGEGKTEAAIYLATHWMAASGQTGLYMALPTAATSNQMHRRVQEFLAPHDPQAAVAARLVHGTSWLLDEATPIAQPELSGEAGTEAGLALDWFRPRKRTLLSQYGVGTIDQAHMSVLHVRFGFLRLFGLAGKVLVVDEVHAYDAYMSEFLEHLLRWCRVLGVPVILLSATLPTAKRRALMEAYAPAAHQPETNAPYPLITLVSPAGAIQEEAGFETRPTPPVNLYKHAGLLGDPKRIAALVAERVGAPGCIGVIASTVGSAQAIYRELEQILPGDVELLLFHARFTAERRQELEKAVLDRLDKRSLLDETEKDHRPRPKRLVLVATQVVEQSLDLDFDELFTELAPIDLLLQRLGRLWRHADRDRRGRQGPNLHIFLPEAGDAELGPAGKVYSHYILRQTAAAIADRERIALPGDLRGLIQQVYDQEPIPESPWWQDWQALVDDLGKARTEAKAYLIPDPKPALFTLTNFDQHVRDEEDEGAASYFAVRTRQGDYTRSVLALEGDLFTTELSAPRPPAREVLKAIYRQSVALPAWWLTGVTAAAGYAPIQPAPDWIPGCLVLRLKDGQWAGMAKDGAPFAMTADPTLGFERMDSKGV